MSTRLHHQLLMSTDAKDPLFAFVISLLHFEGTNGSTVFTDQIPGTIWTPTSAVIDTSQSKFGVSSGAFIHHSALDSIIANTSAAFNVGTSGDYCVEFFINQIGTGFDECAFSCRNPSGIALLNCSNGLGGVPAIFNTIGAIVSGPIQLTPIVWHYLVFERWSGNVYFWVDGVLIGSAADAQNTTFSGMSIGNIGAFNFSANSWIDESRVTKHARYFGASTIPIPTSRFPNS